MRKLTKKLTACSGLTLYAEQPGGTVGITGHLCGDKLCFVCNSQRSRVTRRKYRTWFTENETLFQVTVNGKPKVVTAFQYNKHHAGAPYNPVLYDVMHFTLTVPHTADKGFRGKELYYDEFTNCMTELRRLKFWKENILGGEYGFETERKNAGAHIHVHGLMFVQQSPKNRNKVHRQLLKAWNRLTIDEANTRPPFTETDIAGILKGNNLLTREDVAEMDQRGSTIINLETIYTRDPLTKKKIRVKSFSDKSFMRGVMEAIKYHFEPAFFDKENKAFDLQMIADIKPLIHGKALYKKFGCLVGETALNISENIEVEYSEAADEVDQETGEILDRDFYIVNPALMYANEENITWSAAAMARRRKLTAHSTHEAVSQLASMIKSAGKSGQLG